MASPTTEPLRYSKTGAGVAWITLNRPDVLNAINLEIRDALWTYLHAAQDDPDVRVLGFRGVGARAFSTGADITEFGTASSIFQARAARRDRDVWALLESLPLITMAALHGYCFGAGIELALFCDIRIAATDTQIALPEVALGYIPSAGGTQMAPRIAPAGVAAALALGGAPIDAAQALEWGIVSEVVASSDLDQRIETLAQEIAAHDTLALGRAKQSILRGLDRPLDVAIAHDADLARLARADRRAS